LLCCGHAFAATFNFDVIYDGTDITLAPGSDPVIGSILVDGDDFTYNVRAAGTDFWRVDATANFFPFLAFTVNEEGNRKGNFTLELLLDGVQQFYLPESLTPVINSEVHLGTNDVSLTAGLEFDQIVLQYTLDMATDVDDLFSIETTLNNYSIGPNFPGGFNPDVSYIAAVPLPGALGLLGLGWLSLVGRRRKG
jgi:hypothetical protein